MEYSCPQYGLCCWQVLLESIEIRKIEVSRYELRIDVDGSSEIPLCRGLILYSDFQQRQIQQRRDILRPKLCHFCKCVPGLFFAVKTYIRCCKKFECLCVFRFAIQHGQRFLFGPAEVMP